MASKQPELPPLAQLILHTLLDQTEQLERQKVARVRLNQSRHADYFSEHDAGPRLETNTALQALEEQGWLRLRWQKWEQGNWLEAVDLLLDGTACAALYTVLSRTPLTRQETALRKLLAAQTPQTSWQASFLSWVGAQLDARRSVAPLSREDEHWNSDLLSALAAIGALRSPTLERSLSVRLFNNSKRLEELRWALLRVLRRHNAEASAFGEDDWALLRAQGLDRVPEYVPLAGPLTLRLAGADGDDGPVLDLEPFRPSVALSVAMLRRARVSACAARLILTVENAASFSELVAVRPASILALYTGGFASPSVIAFLRGLRANSPDVPLMHWGDLDAGGLRILAHLRAHLGSVTPLAMDVATFEAHRAHAQPLTPTDRATLTQLRATPALLDCTALIDCLLATSLKLEQEAVRADLVVREAEQTKPPAPPLFPISNGLLSSGEENTSP